MKILEPRRWMVAAGGLLVMLAPAAARAEGDLGLDDTVVAIAAAALLLPSEVGAAIPTADPSTTHVVLGWSWQFPVSLLFNEPGTRHRLVGSVDLLPHRDGVSWRGRLGYRYAGRYLFGGAGVGIDGAGANLSPELGVKFLQRSARVHDSDSSLHLLARAEVAPESGQVRGATVLLGWNLF